MSKETLQLLSTIEIMKRQIETRDNKIHALETDYSLEIANFKNDVTTLRTDLIISQCNLKREMTSRMEVEKGKVCHAFYLFLFK